MKITLGYSLQGMRSQIVTCGIRTLFAITKKWTIDAMAGCVLPLHAEMKNTNNFSYKKQRSLSLMELQLIGEEITYRKDESTHAQVVSDVEVAFGGQELKACTMDKRAGDQARNFESFGFIKEPNVGNMMGQSWLTSWNDGQQTIQAEKKMCQLMAGALRKGYDYHERTKRTTPGRSPQLARSFFCQSPSVMPIAIIAGEDLSGRIWF